MSTSELISKLRQSGIRLQLSEAGLTLKSGKAKVADGLVQEVKAQKEELIAYLEKLRGNAAFESIPVAEQQAHYPLSNAQHRLWMLNQIEEERVAYNMPAAYALKGALDVAAFEQALKAVCERHETLRTAFVTIDDVAMQVVDEECEPNFAYHDLCELFCAPEMVAKRAQEAADSLFDLGKAPLLSVQVLKLAEAEFALLFNMHHLIADGWSVNVLISDLAYYYRGFSAQEFPFLPPLQVQYKDYCVWQKQLLESERVEAHRDFWLQQLSGELPVLELPYDRPRPAVRTHRGSTVTRVVDGALAEQLRELGLAQGVSLFMLLMSAVKVLLFRYSGQEDNVVGTTSGGREHADLEGLIGLFINALPIRTSINPDAGFDALLEQVRGTITEVFEHQSYPFDRIVEDLKLVRDQSRHPVFDVMVIMQNTEAVAQAFEGFELEQIPRQTHISKFDLTFNFIQQQDSLQLVLEYNTDLFAPDSIARMVNHLTHLFQSIVAAPSAPVCALAIVPRDEQRLLLHAFNHTHHERLAEQTVVTLFEQQAAQLPEALAVAFGDEQLTYEVLNTRANRLAGYLAEVEIGAGDFVGLYLERGPELIVAMLAVLKSGAAFVPFDSAQQGERLQFMMQDAGIELMLMQSHLMANLSFDSIDVMMLDPGEMTDDWLVEYGSVNPFVRPDSASAAYVIYTSGSTGNPKGCCIQHTNLANYLGWANRYYFSGNTAGNFGLFTSIGFDFTLTSIFCPLTRGKALYIFPPGAEMQHILAQVFDPATPIDAVKLTPSHSSILGAISSTNVQVVIAGGEALQPHQAAKFHALNPELLLVNEYGPTETTVGCVAKTMHPDSPVVIGAPIDNTRVYILDAYDQLVPVGVVGELCIAGACVGAGYINNEGLTSARFVANPFEPGRKMYRSGDKARWLPTGDIDYLGRIDNQVKIRGHRIEPGEIEHQLVLHPMVEEAVVLDKVDADGQRYLATYVVGAESLLVEALREHLAKSLPEYMIPAYFTSVEQIPLTANGKVDRVALLTLDDGGMELGSVAEAPRNATEQVLADVWQEVLKVPSIGINDNFFHLGGDSIKAIQLSAKMQRRGLQFELSALFQHPTIKGLSALVSNVEVDMPQEEVAGLVPLTPIQQVFVRAEHPKPSHYNQSVMLFRQQGFSKNVLEQTLEQLVAHHDALRMRFDLSASPVAQFNLPVGEKSFALSAFDCRHVAVLEDQVAASAAAIHTSLDIENGPLVHVGLFHTSKGDHLLFVIHHLVVDGVSWRILLEDFATTYQALEAQLPVALPPKTMAFRAWANALHAYADSGQLLQELPHWQSVVNAEIPSLPRDGQAVRHSLAVSAVQSFSLSEEQTASLIGEAGKAYATGINDVLLTALALMINSWQPTDLVRVHLEGHGREQLLQSHNTSRTVGWFTSLFPVVLPVENPDDLEQSLLGVKAALESVPNKGIGYGVLRHLVSPAHRRYADLALPPEIVFNYLGQFDLDFENDFFSPSWLPSGENKSLSCHREQVLGMNAMVANGQFTIRLDYNTEAFHHATIEQLLVNFGLHLTRLVEYCAAVAAGTPKVSASSGLVSASAAAALPNKRCGIALNAPHQQKVFAFPTLYGMAIGYLGLAKALDNVCLIAFDFLDDPNWRARYREAIKDHQSEGPYVFYGYSGGATLAYEMARFFEEHGDDVASIIMIDQAPDAAPVPMSEWELDVLADGMLDPSDSALQNDALGKLLVRDAALRSTVKKEIIAYKRLLSQLATAGVVRSDIHLIVDEASGPEARDQKFHWQRHTSGRFSVVEGVGAHRQLFAAPFFQTNVAHVQAALRESFA